MPQDPKATPAKSGRTSRRKAGTQSQLVDLFFDVARRLGFETDREIAELAGVSPENVANWRAGSVKEFKKQKLEAIKIALANQIELLKEQAGVGARTLEMGLLPLEVEEGSGPADLQRKFRSRVVYDYLGHGFLYYESMGALAWENLIKRGYEQDRWLKGVEACAVSWLDTTRGEDGAPKGPIAAAMGHGRRPVRRGLDVISLGPGEGEKELVLLRKLSELDAASAHSLEWLTFAPVDVSIPLLLTAGKNARRLFATTNAGRRYQTRAFCADFEEGRLTFVHGVPTASVTSDAGRRLVLMLGNTFGNLRDEETFIREQLTRLARPGDLVWLEVGLRLKPLDKDPLFQLTSSDRALTATEANRRLLLEGPYRRWEAATGRSPSRLSMRVWVREDDESARIPGSVNFCHDLILEDERRACTMLYSRRYDLEPLSGWLEGLGFSVLRIKRIEDSKQRNRIAHILLSRN